MKIISIDVNHGVRHYDATRKNCPHSMKANSIFTVGSEAYVKMDKIVANQGNEKEKFSKIDSTDRFDTLKSVKNN